MIPAPSKCTYSMTNRDGNIFRVHVGFKTMSRHDIRYWTNRQRIKAAKLAILGLDRVFVCVGISGPTSMTITTRPANAIEGLGESINAYS